MQQGRSDGAGRRALASKSQDFSYSQLVRFRVPPGSASPARDAFGRCGTSGVHDTHKTVTREVHYLGHPWYGQQVYVQAAARRGGRLVLRCVRGELNRSPALEIPEWMFDSGLCNGMKQDSVAYVSSAASLDLTCLLSAAVDPIESSVVQAQHLSSSSGGVDADNVAIQNQSGRAVFSSSAVAAAATGSLSADGAVVGPDDERTSAEGASPQRAGGGGR